MFRLRELCARLFGFHGRGRRETDLDREIGEHLHLLIDERVREGMSPADARRSAVRELGGIAQVKEAYREQQGLPAIDSVLRDVLYAWRLIRARPSFTAAVVLAIALGVGTNAAVFSVAHNVVWRPLPFDQPDRLVRLYQSKAQDAQMPVSALNFLDWAKLLPSFEALAAWRGWTYDVAGAEGNEAVPGARVTASLFAVLRVQPALGRAFLETEDSPSGQPVAVISHAWWHTRFGGSPDVIGRPLPVGNVVYTIVGVLPRGVSFPAHDTAIWTPLRIGDASHRMRRTENYLNVLARLGQGVTLSRAQDEAGRAARLLAAEYPASNTGLGIVARSLHDVVTGSARTPLLLLAGVAVGVLLISCANVAHLLMARALSREGELTLRAALGATSRRLLRQSFTESLLLACAGSILGVLAAMITIELLRPALPASLPRRHEIRFDVMAFGYALLCTVAVCVVAGTAPALHARRASLDQRLKQHRQSSSRRLSTVGRAAIVVQVTLSVVLLIATLLMVQSFRNVLTVDSGFVSQDVVVTSVGVPSTTPQGRVAEYFETLVEEVTQVKGVEAAGLVNHVPLTADSSGTRFTIEHRGTRPEDVHMAAYRVVSPTYFATIGARLLRGRYFSASDRPDSPAAFVINETMARWYWGAQDPVGTRIRRGGTDSTMPHATIVGVVADMKQGALDQQPKPEIFIPHAQFPWPAMNLAVRTSRPLEAVVPDLRATLTRVGGAQSVQAIRSFDDVVWATVSARAFTSTLLVVLTLLAATVAMLGVYAVTGHVTAARTKELAIRAALGASRSSVVDAAVGHTLRLVVAGLALGTASAYAVARTMSTALFGIAPFDPFTYAASTVALGVVAVLAALGPARRALQSDPVVALRAD